MSALSVFRGDDKSFKVTIKDGGSVKDITGWTVFFTVKKSLSDTDAEAVISKDITSHTDAANGITHIALSNTDTDIGIGLYKADIQVLDDQSKIQTYKILTFTVKQDVTLRES